MLKIVQIVAGDELGGAVRAALSLHYELKKAEMDSKILLQFGSSNSSDVEIVDKTNTNDSMRRLRYIKDQAPFRLHRNRKKYIFSPGIFGMNLSDHNLINKADVVHLNWITNGYVDLRTFRLFKNRLSGHYTICGPSLEAVTTVLTVQILRQVAEIAHI